MTKPQVINGPASSGQQVWMGRRDRSTVSQVASRQGALRTILGAISSTFLYLGRVLMASLIPLGGSGSFKKASSLPTSAKASVLSSPMPRATRLGVPNKLPSKGISLFGFSNNNAGPPARKVRSQISVISRFGSTSTDTRLSSLWLSNPSMKSRRSLYCIV